MKGEDVVVTVRCAGGGRRPDGASCWFTGQRQTVNWVSARSGGQPTPVDPLAKPCPRCGGRIELVPKATP
jgi:hypothetical protein